MSDVLSRPPISHESLSVILVAEDDQDIVDTTTAWATLLSGLNRTYEIILVRPPQTAPNLPTELTTVVDEPEENLLHDPLAAQLPNNASICYSELPGVGAALREGIARASHPLLFFTLCNKQFQPADLARLLESIDQVDLVTGYRVPGPVPGWLALLDALRRGVMRVLFGMDVPRVESWLGWAAWKRRTLARWLFGVAVQDPQCAFRLFRRHLFQRIPIQSNSDFAHSEILAKANFLGALIQEVPVTWLPPSTTPGVATRCAGKGEILRLFTKPDFGPVTI